MNKKTVNKFYYKAIRLAVGIMVFFVAGTASSQEWEQLFHDGNQNYSRGEFVLALGNYFAVRDAGQVSGELYYNIGNTYFKLGSMGNAILYYEKARRLMPNDEDLLNNIQFANVNIVDRIIPVPEIFYVRIWHRFRTMMSIVQWKAFFITAWFMTALIVILLFFIRQLRIRKYLKIGLRIAVVFLVIIAGVLYSSSKVDKPGTSGVVLAEEVTAYSSPEELGTESFMIHEGTVFSIKSTRGDWCEIRLADGKEGWILQEHAEVI
ncbi:SH3 domain-containing protein [candidate division KSB1 bacterium]